MSTDKEGLYNKLKKIAGIPCHRVFKVCLFLLGICMISDFCLHNDSFYEESSLIAIIVLIWTFTVSFSVYCMEHFGESYYGIRRVDILLADLKPEGAYYLTALIFMELIALISSTFLQFSITIIAIAFQQTFITIYILILVIVKTSYTNTLEQIQKEIESKVESDLEGLYLLMKGIPGSMGIERKNWPMLFRMVKELDYNNISSRERLLEILIKVSELMEEVLKRHKCFGCKEKIPQIRKEINSVGYQIVIDILGTKIKKEVVLDFLKQLMRQKEISLEFRRGVMMALLEELTLDNIVISQELLRTEMIYQRELQIWCAVYNVYMQEFDGEQWRRSAYTGPAFCELYTNWDVNDSQNAVDAWEQMQQAGEKITYEPLFQYIFPNDGKEIL